MFVLIGFNIGLVMGARNKHDLIFIVTIWNTSIPSISKLE